jgi:hypothetical protein
VSYHWLIQPVVLVSDDGRSANGRLRLFQPRTGKDVGKAGDFYGASVLESTYHDGYVLEDGIWRIWDLTVDPQYIRPVAFKDGIWAKATDPPPPDPNAPRRTGPLAGRGSTSRPKTWRKARHGAVAEQSRCGSATTGDRRVPESSEGLWPAGFGRDCATRTATSRPTRRRRTGRAEVDEASAEETGSRSNASNGATAGNGDDRPRSAIARPRSLTCWPRICVTNRSM